MRRTTLHRTTVAAAAALLLAGCGTQGGAGNAGSGAVSPSPSTPPTSSPNPSPSSTSSPASPSEPQPTGDCAPRFQLTAADQGRTLCLTRGGQVRITLDGTKDRPWTPVVASGSSLKAVNPGIVLLPGDANAAYEAVAPGTAELTSTRPLCAAPTGPGQVSCHGIQEWTVTVRVR